MKRCAPGASPLGTWESTDPGLGKLKSFLPPKLLTEKSEYRNHDHELRAGSMEHSTTCVQIISAVCFTIGLGICTGGVKEE